MINKVFGKLTVISYSHNTKDGKRLWNCICECGNSAKCTTNNLNSGRSKTCGCSRTILSEEEAYIKDKYNNYKNQAKIRQIEVQLSFEQFKELVSQPCYWCGELPKLQSKTRVKRVLSAKTNGVDRLNSSEHYTVSNCVSCCSMCNWMKQEFTVKDFLNKVKQIANKHQEAVIE